MRLVGWVFPDTGDSASFDTTGWTFVSGTT
jgi:hypothetical protein